MRASRLLHDDEVIILKVTTGEPDDDGVPNTTTSRHRWKRVNVQQVSAEELTDQGRNTSVTTFRVSGSPAPVAIDSADEIEWRGLTYEITADPDARTGRARINHTSLQMVRVRG